MVDFTGTGAQRAATSTRRPAVTRAAVLYVFRCLVGDDIPLNDGCLKPMMIVSRRARSCRPRPGAAVVAGNIEISQAACNALFGALGAIAASQATMNNFLFGDATGSTTRRSAAAPAPGPVSTAPRRSTPT